MKITKTQYLLLFIFLLLGSIFLAFYQGSTNVSLGQLFSVPYRPILELRAARIILSLLAGSGLGVCGVTLQALLRNVLAEPYLLGTSSGAGLGTIIAVLTGLTSIYIPFAAFLGALFSIMLVYFLAREKHHIPTQALILSGVIIAITFSGIIAFLTSISTQKALHGLLWWLLGSLQIYDYKLLGVVGIIVLLGIASIFFFSQDLNAISLGEEEAIHLGIDTNKVKKILFLLTSLITGAIVSVTGIIGFVGLIIPHILRLLIGPNHKVLLPATCLVSGAFLVFCDTLSRSLIPPLEIPIGVITAAIGAPIFIILLKTKFRGMTDGH